MAAQTWCSSFSDLMSASAALGCYGSAISTPTMDRSPQGGLRYNNFHTTALCSPTRAALLTGRNHHAVGMSIISNADSGYPGKRRSTSARKRERWPKILRGGLPHLCRREVAPGASGSDLRRRTRMTSGRSEGALTATTVSSTRSLTSSHPT